MTAESPPPNTSPLALVMSGGGARAAYQVGVLRAVVRRWPAFRPPIITGVSAGAINAAALAARDDSFAEAVGSLSRLWSDLTTDEILRADLRSIGAIGWGWGRKLVSGGRAGRAARSLVDTAPLRRLLERVIGGETTGRAIEQNIFTGKLDSFAISATDYGTGRSVTWVQGRGIQGWNSPQHFSIRTQIGVDHVMASAALPLAFPAIYLGGSWYGDGGIRQIAPLSEAIHLGADRILAVNTRHARTIEEAEISAITDYPPPAQIVGVLVNAVFLDSMDRDAQTLRRISRMVRRLPEDQRENLRPIDVLILRPSQDLARLAAEYEHQVPRPLRFMLRGLGTRETESPDWLSMLLFEPDYLRRVMEIGEFDAEQRIEEIGLFLGVSDRSPPAAS